MVEFLQQNFWYLSTSLFYSFLFAGAFKNGSFLTNNSFLNFLLFALVYLIIDGTNILVAQEKSLIISPYIYKYNIYYLFMAIISIRLFHRVFFHQKRYFYRKD